jgi:hypothetical protein
MADLVFQELDGADGRKLAAKFWVQGVRAFGKNKPNAVVPRRFGMISKHTDDAVAEVDGKTGKHVTDFGVQGCEGFQNERMRRLLFWFGGARHDLFGLSEMNIADWS